jgi:autotransporter family porin
MRFSKSLLIRSLLLSAAVISPLSSASAADYNWTANTSNDWNDGTNWNTGLTPSAGHYIYVNQADPLAAAQINSGTSSMARLFVGAFIGGGTRNGHIDMSGTSQISTSEYAYMGYANSNGTSTATIDMSDSARLITGTTALIGYSNTGGNGSAVMTMSDNSLVRTTTAGYLGYASINSTASLNLTMSDSSEFHTTTILYVGGANQAGNVTSTVNMTDNAYMHSNNSSIIGWANASAGNTSSANTTINMSQNSRLESAASAGYMAIGWGQSSATGSSTGNATITMTDSASISMAGHLRLSTAGSLGGVSYSNATIDMKDDTLINVGSYAYLGWSSSTNHSTATILMDDNAQFNIGTIGHIGFTGTGTPAFGTVNTTIDMQGDSVMSIGQHAEINYTLTDASTASTITLADNAAITITNHALISSTVSAGGIANSNITLSDASTMTMGDYADIAYVNGGGSSTASITLNDDAAVTIQDYATIGHANNGASVADLVMNGNSTFSVTGPVTVGNSINNGNSDTTISLFNAALFETANDTILGDGDSTGTTQVALAVNNNSTYRTQTLFTSGNTGSESTITVNGSGANLDITGTGPSAYDVYLGLNGKSSLTVSNGGTVKASNGINLGYDAATRTIASVLPNDAVINIGAAAGQPAVAAGFIVGDISTTDGNGTLNFNHTNTAYDFDNSITGAIDVNHYAGQTIFNGANYSYTGDTNVYGGQLAINSTVNSSDIIVASGASLGGNGIFNKVTNSGTLSPGMTLANNQFATMTIHDYEATSGATVALRTYLEGDASQTDKLVITGSGTGVPTQLLITSVGGTGYQTNTGIRVVEAQGGTTIAAGAFTLANNVCAGIFCYNLVQGDGTLGGASDYFLQSSTSAEQVQQVFSPVVQPGMQSDVMVRQGLTQNLMVARSAFTGPLAALRRPILTAAAEASVMSDAEPANRGWYFPERKKYAAYATGTFGIGQGNDYSNHSHAGSMGIMTAVTENIAVGGGILTSRTQQSTAFRGNNDVESMGVTLLMAYEPQKNGLRFYGSTAVASMDLQTDRRYLNGTSVESSTGSTNGYAMGVAGRVGYSTKIGATTALMPYGELQWSKTKFNGYTERGPGSQPATIGDQQLNRVSSTLGFELTEAISDATDLRFNIGWGHALSGNGSTVDIATQGISQSIYGSQGDNNWVDTGISGTWRVTPRTSLVSDLNIRVGDTVDPAAQLMIGVAYSF